LQGPSLAGTAADSALPNSAEREFLLQVAAVGVADLPPRCGTACAGLGCLACTAASPQSSNGSRPGSSGSDAVSASPPLRGRPPSGPASARAGPSAPVAPSPASEPCGDTTEAPPLTDSSPGTPNSFSRADSAAIAPPTDAWLLVLGRGLLPCCRVPPSWLPVQSAAFLSSRWCRVRRPEASATCRPSSSCRRTCAAL
jgi:hypothetical protein